MYSSLFKHIFADTGFLVNTFSLSTSNMSAPYFQTSRISDQKSADDLIQTIICGDSHLTCCFYVLIFGFWKPDYSESGCGSLWVDLIGVHWTPWTHVFPYTGDVFSHCFFTYPPHPPLSLLLGTPHRASSSNNYSVPGTQALSTSFQLFLLFLRPSFHCPFSKSTDPLFCPLKSSFGSLHLIFHLSYCTFQLQNLFFNWGSGGL